MCSYLALTSRVPELLLHRRGSEQTFLRSEYIVAHRIAQNEYQRLDDQ